MLLTLSDEDAQNLVEWASEIGTLSYSVAPDPSPIGVGIRERVQSIKHVLHADPAPPPPPPSPAPRLMFDSDRASDIPAGTSIVAGYLDGAESQWSAADWERFPDAIKVTITVLGNIDADVADVENGDLNPVQGAAWVRRRLEAGIAGPHVIYCNLSTLPAVRAECTGLPVSYWVAHYTDVPHMEEGEEIVATQFVSPGTGSGGHYDISLCSDSWPHA